MSQTLAALQKSILENNSSDGWPVAVDMKVIDPGTVYYEDLVNNAGEHAGGCVLVQKATLDKMAASMVGKPIINWDHRKVSPSEFSKGKFQGIITETFYNSADGWYHARGFVWDQATLKNIENGHSISCAYTVHEWGEGGTYHKVPYQKEVLNGAYTHIAVVPVPRYEGAKIELLNSGGSAMFSFFRKDKPEDKIEIDPTTTKVALDGGAEIPLADLINSFKAVEAAKPTKLEMTDLIDVDGKKVPLSELVNAHKASLENSVKDAHEKGEHKDLVANCASCTSSKEDAERKNAAAKVEAELKAAEELKNSAKTAEEKAKAEAKKAADALEQLRNAGHKVEMPSVKSLKALQAEGESRYGTLPTTAAK